MRYGTKLSLTNDVERIDEEVCRVEKPLPVQATKVNYCHRSSWTVIDSNPPSLKIERNEIGRGGRIFNRDRRKGIPPLNTKNFHFEVDFHAAGR